MYAFFAEKTNIPPKDIGKYTIEQIEYLMAGFNKNNKNDNRLEGKEALEYLISGKTV